MKSASTTARLLNPAVIVGALGYFVDIFDLLLFSIVRVPSLKSIGVPPEALLDEGVKLLNLQMFGLLTGGLIWGILGDKRGRVSVLFGSIFLYSLANILNAFVHDTTSYGVLRFISGVGLAGELGAAITLVSEVMSKETRGYGTAVVAGIGVCGALLAATVGEQFEWRTCFLIGGGLGLLLLVLRVSLSESGMFSSAKEKPQVTRGDFFSLFTSWDRFKRYLSCILIGTPIWFVIGILVTFSPELSAAMGVTTPVVAGKSVFYSYFGFALGDVASGVLSQKLKSRRKAVGIFLALTGACILTYLFSRGISDTTFYGICIALGFASGYWAVFITIGAEQFGTNLRATVATTVPNFVRGMAVPITLSFQSLKGSLGTLNSALAVGSVTLVIGFVALLSLRETYGKDLDFTE